MNESIKIKRQFYHSLKRGTGEAYLLMKDHPGIDFSTYLIKGALINFAYDGQSEGDRAAYIFQMIELSDKKEKIRRAILKGLATEQEDTWSLTHLFELVKLYALQGDQKARQAIYDRFLNHPIEGSDWAGYVVILELDGLDGLIFIAEKYGKYLDENPDDWQDDSIIKHFQNEYPGINAMQELKKLTKTNKHIKKYLTYIKRTADNRKNNVREKQKFKDTLDEVINSKITFWRSRNLSEKEILIIANHLLIEKNKSNQYQLLRFFYFYKFPFDPNFILKLAQQKRTSKNRIKEYAIYALKHLKSEDIRSFALKKILKTYQPSSFTDILISNYKEGDSELLTTVVKKFKNEHIIESLVSSYVDIYKLNKTKECVKPLLELYRKMNCGIHRHTIIEILIENKVLPIEIEKEIEFDSYEETRAVFQEIKKA